MDYILELFEAKKEEFKDDLIIGPCINSGWSKLDKYYELTSDSPAYTAALVLNPAFKWEYIEKTWPKEWILQARESVASLWKLKYRPTISIQVPDTLVTIKSNHFSQWKAGKHATRYVYYELVGYIEYTNSYIESQHQTEMNTGDIYDFLYTMILMMFVSSGSYQSKSVIIQTFHVWPLIYYQSLLCQHQLSGSFRLQI